MSGSNILFVVTGSIAGYKACEAVSQLVRRGHRVRTAATPAALRFVGAATLEGLTGEPVRTDLFAPGAALEHIDLTRWADAVVVCPATAHTLNRFAAGLADDLVGALFLAHDWTKPFLVAPAMNPAMWSHPATVAATDKLRRWGVRFIAVGTGRTACGEVGEGRMAEPAEIVAAVEAVLKVDAPSPPRSVKVDAASRCVPLRSAVPQSGTASTLDRGATPSSLRILVTSGGTSEPIDGVRVLTNLSTGRTGAGIAAHFARAGHDVTLLRASHAAPGGEGIREETFLSFADLDRALDRLLSGETFDVVIHAAAVGDFGIEAVVVGGSAHPPGDAKLGSDALVQLRLRPQPKLLDTLRARSGNPDLHVVAFKLTTGADAAAVRDAVAPLLARGGADLVVHNDLAARADAETFPSDIYDRNHRRAAHCATRTNLAVELERLLAAMPFPIPIPIST